MKVINICCYKKMYLLYKKQQKYFAIKINSPNTKQCFPVGRHKTQEVPKGTLNSILTKAGVK